MGDSASEFGPLLAVRTAVKPYSELLHLNEDETKEPLIILVKDKDADEWSTWLMDEGGNTAVQTEPNVFSGVVLIKQDKDGNETNYAMVLPPDQDYLAKGKRAIFVKSISEGQYKAMGDGTKIKILRSPEKKA